MSKVEDMSEMFWGSKFNQALSRWNPMSAKNMSFMFRESNFNHDISNWNVSKVKRTVGMFIDCRIDVKNMPV